MIILMMTMYGDVDTIDDDDADDDHFPYPLDYALQYNEQLRSKTQLS